MRTKLLSLLLVSTTMVLATGCLPAEKGPWIRTMDLGGSFGCYIDAWIDGLQCWGQNNVGQSSPPALSNSTAIATGVDFACALDNGSLVCWGNKPAGTLNLTNPKSLSAGNSHVCVLDDNGVSCLGNPVQTVVPALNSPSEIAADGDRTCVIDGNNVQCWGDTSDSMVLSSPSNLAVGGGHVCVLAAGQIECAGSELDVINNIPTVSNPISLAASTGYSCVIDDAGAQCWGAAALSAVLTPRDMTWPTRIVAGGDGSNAHACVRHLQGITCWGDNNTNQLAVYDGNDYHGITRGEAVIDATPEEIWAVLMDLDNYGTWNPFTIEMTSTLQIGAPVLMTVAFNPPLLVIEQVENVRVLEPNYKVCWGIDDATRDFVTGERCQWLEPAPGGKTRYITEDLIEGTTAPLTYDRFGVYIQAGFQGVADALKVYLETP